MGIRTLSGNLTSLRRFSERIRGLPKDPAAKERVPRLIRIPPRVRSATTALVFFIVSGILAWSAQDLVHASALREWESKRAPSPRIWENVLLMHGFKTAPLQDRRAWRKLPSTQDRPGSVWISPDTAWIAVFGPDSPTLFCTDCGHPPETWNYAGMGWTGFDAAFEQIENRPSTVASLTRHKAAPLNFHDPREINY